MLTTRTARWSAVTGLVCVVVLVATWFVLVSPRRSQAADLDAQRTSAEATNVSLEAEIAELQRQFAGLDELRDELKVIRAQLPPAADVPRLVRSLSDLAADSGVEIESIVPGAVNTLTPASGTSPALVSVEVAVTVRGRYVEGALFLRYLQTRLNRVFLVSQVNAKRNEDESNAGSAAATATATPTTTATATSTPTPTSTTPPPPDDFTITMGGEVFSLVDAPTATPPAGAAATPAPAPAAGGAPAPTQTTQ